MPRKPSSSRGFKDVWMQYIRGTVTESGAATFTEATLNMPVVISQGLVVEMHTIEFQVPQLVAVDIKGTDDEFAYQLQITKASQNAIITLDDPDLIAGYELQIASPDLQTAEKATGIPIPVMGSLNRVFPMPILLPFEQLYFGASINNGSVASTFKVRIGFLSVKLSSRQVVELVQAIT